MQSHRHLHDEGFPGRTPQPTVPVQRYDSKCNIECHDLTEVGNTLERACIIALPRHHSPSLTRPHATLCNQSQATQAPLSPPGQTKPPFRTVPVVIMQCRSNLLLLAAYCEATQAFSMLQRCCFVHALCIGKGHEQLT